MWKPKKIFINDKGYLTVANSRHIMKLSRYLVILKYGKKAVKNKQVHHRLGFKFEDIEKQLLDLYNREEFSLEEIDKLLCILSPEEHNEVHFKYYKLNKTFENGYKANYYINKEV